MGQHFELRRIVLEGGRDDIAIELIVPIPAQTERSADRVEDPAHTPALASQVENLPTRIEVSLAFLDQRDPIVRLVVRNAATEVAIVRRVRQADFPKTRSVE